jgi:hypothetical protein
VKLYPFLPSILAVSLGASPSALAEPPEPPASTPVQRAGATGQPDPPAEQPASPVRAGAATRPTATVWLNGRGAIRGTLVDVVPDDHATVELATGGSSVISWGRIRRIERGHGPSLGADSPDVPDEEPSRSTAAVHIEADAHVVIERRDPGARTLVPACTAPCDMALPLSASYRAAGSDVRSSAPFHLGASSGERVLLDVHTAPQGPFVGGVTAASVGGGAVVVGGIVLSLNWFLGVLSCSKGDCPGPSEGVNDVGFVMVGAGAAALVAGVAVLVTSSRSTVTQSAAPAAPATDAWLRLPQWHEKTTIAALPNAVGAPIFEGAF